MVEPEIAENTVPATTATTASRPGTWPDQVLDAVDHLHREPGVEQHLAHEDEERDRREREARHRADAVARELHQARFAAEEQPRAQQVDHQERERDRQAEERAGTVDLPSISHCRASHDMALAGARPRRRGAARARRARRRMRNSISSDSARKPPAAR